MTEIENHERWSTDIDRKQNKEKRESEKETNNDRNKGINEIVRYRDRE